MNFGIKFTKTAEEKAIINRLTKLIESIYCNVHNIDIKNVSTYVSVMVTEVECNQIDCVPIETLVIILDNFSKDNHKYTDKILKPAVDVTEEDIKLLNISNVHSVTTATTTTAVDVTRDNNSSSNSSSDTDVTIVKMKSKPVIESVFDTVPATASHYLSHDIINSTSNNNSNINSISNSNSYSNRIVTQRQQQSQHNENDVVLTSRGKKCPCCDPDNIDNIILFF